MSFSSMRGFSPVTLLGWIRSEIAEGYRRAPRAPQSDPWWQCDPDYLSAWAGCVAEVPA